MLIKRLKIHTRLLFLTGVFLIFSFLLLFYLKSEFLNKPLAQSPVLQSKLLNKISIGLPTRLGIPAINVNTNIQHIGVTQSGEMDVPNNTVDVGWFKFGSLPGERGSAVIAGHFNGKDGEKGIFSNLDKLKAGDKIYVEDNKGRAVSFIVRESRIYDPGYAEEVFSASNNVNDGTHLNLITCDGVWDGNKKSYSKRLVVFADLAV